MKILGLEDYEHPSVPADEAWVVRRDDAERVPPELRGAIEVPCILTGNAFLLKRTVQFFRMVEMWEETTSDRLRKGGKRAKAADVRRSA